MKRDGNAGVELTILNALQDGTIQQKVIPHVLNAKKGISVQGVQTMINVLRDGIREMQDKVFVLNALRDGIRVQQVKPHVINVRLQVRFQLLRVLQHVAHVLRESIRQVILFVLIVLQENIIREQEILRVQVALQDGIKVQQVKPHVINVPNRGKFQPLRVLQYVQLVLQEHTRLIIPHVLTAERGIIAQEELTGLHAMLQGSIQALQLPLLVLHVQTDGIRQVIQHARSVRKDTFVEMVQGILVDPVHIHLRQDQD